MGCAMSDQLIPALQHSLEKALKLQKAHSDSMQGVRYLSTSEWEDDIVYLSSLIQDSRRLELKLLKARIKKDKIG